MAKYVLAGSASAVLLAALIAPDAKAQSDPCSSYAASPPSDPNSVEGQNQLRQQEELKRQCELDEQQKKYQEENYRQTVQQIHRYDELSKAQSRAQSQRAYGTQRSDSRPVQSGVGRSPQTLVLPFGQKAAGDRKADQLTAQGDYAGAVKIWRQLAEQGDVNAQYALGIMYQLGRGVPQSNAQSAIWYRRAADRGYGAAMVNLAWIIVQGARNPAQLMPAYTWVRIAEERDSDPGVLKNARLDISLLTSQMTAAQVSRAEAAAQMWRPQ